MSKKRDTINVSIDREIHHRVKVRAAQIEITVKEFVEGCLKRCLKKEGH